MGIRLCKLLLGYPREDIPELRVPEKFPPVRSEERDDWLERRWQLREDRLRKEDGEVVEAESEEPLDDVDINIDGEEEAEFESRMTAMFGVQLISRLGFSLSALEEYDRPEDGW